MGYDCGRQTNLEEVRKFCRLVEIVYGMTELSGVCVSNPIKANTNQGERKNAQTPTSLALTMAIGWSLNAGY